jgi:hypothetical protein
MLFYALGLTFSLWGKRCDLQGEFYRLTIVIDLIMIEGSLFSNTKKSAANPLLESKFKKNQFLLLCFDVTQV